MKGIIGAAGNVIYTITVGEHFNDEKRIAACATLRESIRERCFGRLEYLNLEGFTKLLFIVDSRYVST
jgi:hypothetical protein